MKTIKGIEFKIPETQEECDSIECNDCLYFPRGYCPGSLEEMKKIKRE